MTHFSGAWSHSSCMLILLWFPVGRVPTLVRFSWDKQAEWSWVTISCNVATTLRGVAWAVRRYFSWISAAKFLIFNFWASTFDTNLFPLFPIQPAANSGPSEVSALNVCFVPLLDSKTNPARSSRSIVACCPSALWMDTSLSLVHVRDQLPTESRVEPGDDRNGWLGVPSFTCPRARWSFSRNSPLLSGIRKKQKLVFSHTEKMWQRGQVWHQVFMVAGFLDLNNLSWQRWPFAQGSYRFFIQNSRLFPDLFQSNNLLFQTQGYQTGDL